ncbi:T9SS type A sorting domain-containing protein [Chitinophaga filiformis]|uniref:Por secretion system C-terminal sorting domain-containing protein n=1 Tax=Chitinophaga filiformis TaxID=104663 RepID=A0A1G7RXA6_CHIFI|nr:T9SS type A sorting domain-containing protein [Chitinophaga filiformis]SDG15314.1 Por secretion system C-terminal sorting domain-containing protein [Chitinophaga filiformis]
MTKTNDFSPFYCRPRFLGAFLLILFCFSQTKLIGQTFGNVALGGGGFVSGIISHKTSGDIYCRTDVGGAYRWDAVNSKWLPLLDWTSEDQTTYQGVEALALDPQNANNLYILAGTSYFNGGKTAILKSTDKGNTFTEVVVTSQFTAHGNGLGRSNGERLAVDPNNSNILFCGTRANGLWKSTNGGSSWTLAWNGVTTTSNGNGICFVVFDPSSVSGGVTKTIYIGVSRTGGNNIYKSTDGGSTFTAIQPDNSFMPHRAVLSSDNSTLYVAMADAEGPSNGSSGRVYKLATATGTWTNITPNGNNYPYSGICVDPANTNRIIASTTNVWNNNQFGNTWADFIFLSTDGGSTWTSKLSSTSTLNTNGIDWITSRGIHWTGSIDFDPLNTARVRVISGNGLFTCDDINASTTSWKFDVKGMEETVVLDAISIPGGKFISAVGDQYGAAYSDVYAYPAQVHTPTVTSNNGIAFAANNINKVVRATDKLYYSTDQGTSWTPAAATNGGGYGKVALSADGNTTLHCPGGGSTTYYSTNNGGSWTSTGVTNVQDAHPIADYVNANKFYIYNPGSGQLLVSTNKGVSFTASSSNPGSGGSRRARAVPGNEGHVWVALSNGLTYTTNNGTSWTTVSNVTYCGAVGFGKAATGATYPAVYIWGTVGGVKGIFRSTDQGASWTRINDDAHEWGGPGNGNFVMGDMNVFGRVYMSTVGRGLVSIESGACTPSAITPYVQLNGGSWQQTASASLSTGGSVLFGPQPVQGGSWSWSGPNNFTATTREAGISNIQANQAGNYVATYTNSGGCQSSQAFSLTVTGSILREYWTGISGTAISNLTSSANYPNNPTGSGQLTSLEGPTNWADNYGARIRGYIYPSATGSYTFWVAGDDNTELYLSTNENPANASRIAYVSGWTNSREWNKYSTQQSVTINLTAGQKYYIEVLQKEASGGDNVAVAWQGPGITQQVIAGNYLSPFVPDQGARMALQANIINEDAVSLYPNPSNGGQFMILLPGSAKNAVVSIYDNLGRLVYTRNAQGGNRIQINSQLKTGLYIVRIISNAGSFTKKLIVE